MGFWPGFGLLYVLIMFVMNIIGIGVAAKRNAEHGQAAAVVAFLLTLPLFFFASQFLLAL